MIILHRESIYKHLEFILKSSIEKRVAINSKSLLSTRKTNIYLKTLKTVCLCVCVCVCVLVCLYIYIYIYIYIFRALFLWRQMVNFAGAQGEFCQNSREPIFLKKKKKNIKITNKCFRCKLC